MTHTSLEQLTARVKERGHPYRILIVDDEPWIREVFSDFCGLTDALEVEMAADGLQAIEMVKKSKFDLVTLDLIMPEISGLDALTEIKKAAPKMPIMIITGNATDKLVHKAGVMGACRVMYKPIQLDDFIAEVTSALTR
jgi:DNA-binding NtrC family response regulator